MPIIGPGSGFVTQPKTELQQESGLFILRIQACQRPDAVHPVLKGGPVDIKPPGRVRNAEILRAQGAQCFYEMSSPRGVVPPQDADRREHEHFGGNVFSCLMKQVITQIVLKEIVPVHGVSQ